MGARLFRCFMHLQWVSLLFAISPLQFLFFLQRPKKTKNKKTTNKKKNNKLHLTPSPWGVQSCFFFFVFLVYCFFVFLFFPRFFAVWPKPREQKKTKKTKSSDPWARPVLSTHKPKNQKTKKPKNQKTKIPKNQKNKKTKIAHPKGRGSDAECWVLSFCFFLFFLFFWFVCG